MILFIVGYLLIGLAFSGLINSIPLVRAQRAKTREQFKDNLLGYKIGSFFGYLVGALTWPLVLLTVVICFVVGFVAAAMGLIK